MVSRSLIPRLSLLTIVVAVCFFLLSLLRRGTLVSSRLRFEISFARDISASLVDGRALLMISTNGKTEPRLQFFRERTWQAQQLFGVDAEALQPEQSVVIDRSTRFVPTSPTQQIQS